MVDGSMGRGGYGYSARRGDAAMGWLDGQIADGWIGRGGEPNGDLQPGWVEWQNGGRYPAMTWGAHACMPYSRVPTHACHALKCPRMHAMT